MNNIWLFKQVTCKRFTFSAMTDPVQDILINSQASTKLTDLLKGHFLDSTFCPSATLETAWKHC